MPSEYVRTRGGRMAHRVTCRYAKSKSAVPWNWAKGMTPREILRECLRHGVNTYQGSCCMSSTQVEPDAAS